MSTAVTSRLSPMLPGALILCLTAAGCLGVGGGGGGGGGSPGPNLFGDTGVIGADAVADGVQTTDATAGVDGTTAADGGVVAAETSAASDAKSDIDSAGPADIKIDPKPDAAGGADGTADSTTPDSTKTDACTALSCNALGAQCGQIFNGCQDIDCGTCPTDKMCGSGVQAHKCVCGPTTCAALSATCGTHPDGCGGQLDCGKCPLCSPVCPAGWSCGNAGACIGGTATQLQLDVLTRTVSGTILVDGIVPVLTGNCSATSTSSVASVNLVEKAKGYSFSFTVPCKTAWSQGFVFSGKIFPGVYEVRAGGDPYYSSLPSGSQKVLGSLDVTAAGKSDLILDVLTRAVAGTILVDGKVPVLTGNCSATSTSSVATVTFTDVAQGYSFSFTTPCKTAWSQGFVFSGKVFPGVYEVRAGGDPYYSSLPSGSQKIIANLDLTNSGKSGLTLDVQTRAVGGTLLVDGKVPVLTGNCTASSTSGVASVTLVEKSQGYSFTFTVQCKTAWSQGFIFTGKVFPGIYEVRAGGDPYYSSLPSGVQKIIGALDVSSTGKVDLALDIKTRAVAGTILVDGKVPVLTGNCTASSTSTVASVTFTDAAQGYSFSFTVPCKTAWSQGFVFSGKVFPGVYEVRAGGDPYYSSLPSGSQKVIGSLDLTVAGKPDLGLDVQTRSVAGTIVVDGKKPVLTGNCSATSTSTVASVTFVEKSLGYTFSFTVPCKVAWSQGFVFSGKVFPGVYEVRAGGDPYYSSLPSGSQKVVATLDLTTNGKADLVLDVQTRVVGGTLLVDGKPPVLTGNCSATSTSTVASVVFTELTQGYSFVFTVPCKTAWSQGFVFSGKVFPGVYEVRAGGDPYYSSLPSGSQVIIGKVSVL